LKTCFSANSWLSFTLYENFLMSLPYQTRSVLDPDKITLENVPTIPFINDYQNGQYVNELKTYQREACSNLREEEVRSNILSKRKYLTLQSFEGGIKMDDSLDFELIAIKTVKIFADVQEAIVGAIFLDSGSY
jgi:hypothetical protein